MPTDSASGGLFWAGWIVTGIISAFLVFDGATKVLKVQPVLDACAKFGLGPDKVVAIGTLLLACTALYVVPRTAMLGAILVTGYLGGAVATHVRQGSSLFETLFPIAFGGLAWLGLLLRDPRLLWTILLRQ